jgi:tetratricopeptide (TPR) repeat protein
MSTMIKYFVFLLFLTVGVSAQSEVENNLKTLYENEEYSVIENYFNRTQYVELDYTEEELFYLGMSLYKSGQIIVPYTSLIKLENSTTLTKKQKRIVKKTLNIIREQGSVGFDHYVSGENYLDSELFSEAKIEFQKCVAIDPNYNVSYYKLMIVAINEQNNYQADNYFKTYTDENPYHVLAFIEMATYLYVQNNNLKKAISILSPLEKTSSVNYYYAKARLYKFDQQYKLALLEANKIIVDERTQNINELIGNLHHHIGSYPMSNRYLTPIFDKDPSNRVAEILAMNYYNLGKYDGSMVFLDYIFKTDSVSHYCYFLKGLCIMGKVGGYPRGKPKVIEAEKYYKIAIDRDSTISKYHYRYGLTLYYGGKKKKAAASFDRAIKINPLNYDVWEARSRCVTGKNSNKADRALGERAVEVFEKAYMRDSSIASVAYGLGMAYDLSKTGLFKKYGLSRARKSNYYLEKAIELDPYQLEYYEELDMNYSYGYEKEKYIDKRLSLALSEVKHLPKRGHGYRELFYLYCDQGNYELANKAYVGMCKNAPNYWLLDQTQNSVYEKRKKYKWSKLPVEYYRRSSWQYVDSISSVLEGKEWFYKKKGCRSVSRKFTFNLKSKTVKVDYSSPIDWQGGQVLSLVYDILGSYKNGLKMRIQGEHRKSWDGAVQVWDLILYNENQFKWRKYPTRQPYYFKSELITCP